MKNKNLNAEDLRLGFLLTRETLRPLTKPVFVDKVPLDRAYLRPLGVPLYDCESKLEKPMLKIKKLTLKQANCGHLFRVKKLVNENVHLKCDRCGITAWTEFDEIGRAKVLESINRGASYDLSCFDLVLKPRKQKQKGGGKDERTKKAKNRRRNRLPQ